MTDLSAWELRGYLSIRDEVEVTLGPDLTIRGWYVMTDEEGVTVRLPAYNNPAVPGLCSALIRPSGGLVPKVTKL